MEELTKIFNNREFGPLEVVLIGGKEHFPAIDCAEMLGYSNPRKAIIDHCKTPGVTIRDVGVETGIKADGTPAIQIVKKKYITEGNLYRLITHSKLPSAEKFERWVFDEVIPDIRRSGVYGVPTVGDHEEIAKLAAAAAAETIAKVLPGMIAETIKQIMPLIGAKLNESKTSKTRELVGAKYIRVLRRGIRYGGKQYWSEQLMNYYGGLVCAEIGDGNLKVSDPSGKQIEVFEI